MISNDMLAALTRSAQIFTDEMIRYLNSGNYPKGDGSRNPATTSIQDATSIGAPQANDKGGLIDVLINLKYAPYALAFEYGSGIHGSKHSLYPIAARNADNLVFWWERENRWFVGSRLGKGHPGIKPRPYIDPSIKAKKKEIVETLGQAFVASIIADFGISKEEFVISL